MKLVGIDVGICRKPFEPLTPAQERAFLKRFAALAANLNIATTPLTPNP
jgi:hypothetical protein